MRSIRFSLMCIFSALCSAATGQGGFMLGYSVGGFTNHQPNYDILQYKMDVLYPEADFNIRNGARGVNLGFAYNDENLYMEFILSNKAQRSNTTNAYSPAHNGELYRYKLKMRFNSFNLGVGYGARELKGGISINFGSIRNMRKFYPDAEFSSGEWEDAFELKRYPLLSFTYFVLIHAGPIQIRPYYQMPLLHTSFLGGLWHYSYKLNNAGISINLILGKNDY
ncbi:MAG: hypothetical protein KKA07_09075 [Bacteroidetes bacterium]|nr:hypothetical protein [Bacteroidota bacterium]MBU1719212.1 hypothetical protein [Bacteroidota bacterium]